MQLSHDSSNFCKNYMPPPCTFIYQDIMIVFITHNYTRILTIKMHNLCMMKMLLGKTISFHINKNSWKTELHKFSRLQCMGENINFWFRHTYATNYMHTFNINIFLTLTGSYFTYKPTGLTYNTYKEIWYDVY